MNYIVHRYSLCPVRVSVEMKENGYSCINTNTVYVQEMFNLHPVWNCLQCVFQ